MFNVEPVICLASEMSRLGVVFTEGLPLPAADGPLVLLGGRALFVVNGSVSFTSSTKKSARFRQGDSRFSSDGVDGSLTGDGVGKTGESVTGDASTVC